ncbi:DUF3558 family protein [Allokutzneria sp. NRRL B-24872]|uniref:DUF3558 family protein n=1 Tax=Allokutzneria sp. NRRL B-24872 TaxID=1137961 RepID=UPI000A398939|nr:DUF3558 family protein [Allokutzneria sp. NRRL B-24872]
MPSWGSRFLATVAVASIAFTAACTSAVPGEPVASPGAEEKAKKAKSKIDPGTGPIAGLGALNTRREVDPCALFPRDAQETLGKNVLYFGGKTKIDVCTFGIEVWAGDPPKDPSQKAPNLGIVDIALNSGMVYLDEETASKGARGPLTKESRDDFEVYSSQEPRICTRRVLFKDKSMIEVEVTTRNNTTQADPCESAETVLSSALKVMRGGQITRRSVSANSLVNVDSCGLVTPDVVTAVTGGTPPRHQGTSIRNCLWTVDPKASNAEALIVDVGLTSTPGEMVKSIPPIAGRPAVTVQLPFSAPGMPGACTVEISHIPFETQTPGKKEAFSVMALTPAGPEAACQKARAGAELIAPKLPAM